MIEREIGNYTLERSLGQGGMGAVWLARRNDERFAGRAAVKFLNLSLIGPEGIERFRREGSVLAHLEHANIARLIDAGVTQRSQPYLVLEYVEGEPIDRWCDSQALDVRARVRLFLQVLAAVAHAHSKLILHRDLKPSNILVTNEGQVKLLDFGTAKLLEKEPDQPASPESTTLAVEHAFTPDYAAPEQVQGEEVSTATDVYALGVLLYEILTGRHPTTDASHTQIGNMRAIVDTEPVSASVAVARSAAGRPWTQLVRALRGDLDNILAMALKKVPGARYQTAAAFADDLRRYLDDEPVRARADSAWYRAGKFVARNWIVVGSAAIVVVAIVIGGGISLWQKHEAQLQRDRARDLAARSGAVIDFVTGMLKDAPADSPISIAELIERSYAVLASEEGPPENKVAVLSLLAQFFDNNNNPSRAEPILTRSLDLTRTSTDEAMRAQLLCQRAGVSVRLGRLQQAMADIEQGLSMSADDDLAAVTCYENRALIGQLANDPPNALAFAVRAQARLRQSGTVRPDWDAILLGQIAYAYYMSGNTAEADRYYAASLSKLKQIGRGESVATYAIRGTWAAITFSTGDTLRALQQYDELLKIVSASSLNGKPPTYLVESRGLVLSQLARYPEALDAFQQAIDLARSSSNMLDLASSTSYRADVYVAMGDMARAQRELVDLATQLGTTTALDSLLAYRITRTQARIAAAQGHLPEALSGFSDVIARPGTPPRPLARTLMERADAYLSEGNSDAALLDAQRALKIARELQRDKPYSSHTGLALATLARVHEKRGEHSEARAAATQAVSHLSRTLGENHPDTQRARQIL